MKGETMFGLISKKRLMKECLEIYFDNDTSKATGQRDFYFRCGCANAVSHIALKCGLSQKIYEEAVRRRTEEARTEQEDEDERRKRQ
jgi:hypothetical protein